MKMAKHSIGVDIGGTKVGIAIVDDDGRIVEKTSFPSNMAGSCELLVSHASNEIKTLLKRNMLSLDNIISVGVGVPGTANMETKVAELCPNLSWSNEPIGDYFHKELGVDIKLIQDSRAAAAAELVYGAGRYLTDFVCVTMGTGLSCGIVINSKIYHGAFNTAGEIGDMVVEKDGRQCNCGNRGCLERYASGIGIIDSALEIFPERFVDLPKTTKMVFDLAEEGYDDAIQLVSKAIEKLGLGIASVINILSPQAIILSGGMSNNEKMVLEPLKKHVYSFAYKQWVLKNPNGVFKSELSSDAPLIGVASLHKL